MAPFVVGVIALNELWAEKVRAALTRRDPAIRDFFDLDYGLRSLGLEFKNTDLLDLVRQKLAISGNEPVDLSEGRRRMLQDQVERQLRPVLREREFEAFSLERIWPDVVRLARSVEKG